MQALAVFLANIFGSLAGFFAQWVTKKTALAVAALSASAAMFVALASVITGLLTGLAVSIPAWAVGGAIFLPENLSLCLSALMTARIARWAYDYQYDNLKIVSSIT